MKVGGMRDGDITCLTVVCTHGLLLISQGTENDRIPQRVTVESLGTSQQVLCFRAGAQNKVGNVTLSLIRLNCAY